MTRPKQPGPGTFWRRVLAMVIGGVAAVAALYLFPWAEADERWERKLLLLALAVFLVSLLGLGHLVWTRWTGRSRE